MFNSQIYLFGLNFHQSLKAVCQHPASTVFQINYNFLRGSSDKLKYDEHYAQAPVVNMNSKRSSNRTKHFIYELVVHLCFLSFF
jgi:hypothetical protein